MSEGDLVMQIKFTVNGHPPKKNDAKSMWGPDQSEAKLVASLRNEAFKARKKVDLGCLTFPISLKLTVFVPERKLKLVKEGRGGGGDLDNFITGVCDGLQAAGEAVKLNKIFETPEQKEINPRKPLLIDNDANVVSIIAKKRETKKDGYYEVIVDGTCK